MEYVQLYQVIDAKGDIGDCQREVICSVKAMDDSVPKNLIVDTYFAAFSPSLYMYLIDGL
jgi:hypothetical protein